MQEAGVRSNTNLPAMRFPIAAHLQQLQEEEEAEMQWEYCTIQIFEENSSQDTPQQGSGYSSQGEERTFLDRLFGIFPEPGKATGKYAVIYFFYRVHGLERHPIYEGDDPVKAEEETSKYVAILGMYGWEAIHIIRLEDGHEHWYF
jgi:hypothetical protein